MEYLDGTLGRDIEIFLGHCPVPALPYQAASNSFICRFMLVDFVSDSDLEFMVSEMGCNVWIFVLFFRNSTNCFFFFFFSLGSMASLGLMMGG